MMNSKCKLLIVLNLLKQHQTFFFFTNVGTADMLTCWQGNTSMQMPPQVLQMPPQVLQVPPKVLQVSS